MARLDIDFTLIDESIVEYGFRVLMSGAMLDGFKANPIMLFQHNRADDYKPLDKQVVLAIGKWYDIRVEGNRLLAKPEFDDDDEFALRIQKKVEKGYYNGASIWVEPITVSDDPELKLSGQPGPTLTKWGILESSIVDIPGCRNALAIRNSAGKKILLNASSNSSGEIVDYLRTLIPNENKNDMDKKVLALKLGLDESAKDADIETKLSAVLADAKSRLSLADENKRLKDQLVDLQNKADENKRAGLVDGAIKDGKLLAGDRDKYMKLAAADFDTTKELIDAMKPHQSVEEQLNEHSKQNEQEVGELMKLSGRELYMNGKLLQLKKLSMEHFKLKYKEAFGVEYTNEK